MVDRRTLVGLTIYQWFANITKRVLLIKMILPIIKSMLLIMLFIAKTMQLKALEMECKMEDCIKNGG